MISYWRGGGVHRFHSTYSNLRGSLIVPLSSTTTCEIYVFLLFCFPGRDQGYHTYTYGWLADQLIRRVDPSHRSAAQFIKEELADPLHVDFFIGLPGSEFYRKAYAYKPGPLEFLYGVKAFFVPLVS